MLAALGAGAWAEADSAWAEADSARPVRCPTLAEDDLGDAPDLERARRLLDRRVGAPIEIAADRIRADLQAGRVRGAGAVTVTRADQLLTTEVVEVDQPAQQLIFPGPFRYQDALIELTSERGLVDVGREQGRFQTTHYRLVDRPGRGSAAHIDLDGAQAILSEARFTTCPPASGAWRLSAGRLTLDQGAAEGRARNITLRLGGVPVLYLPYWSFPLDDRRKSGFLVPTLGNAEATGFELTLPYYINIAANRDATVRPRLLTKRGLELGGELRYLTPRSRGRIDGSLLPNDQLFGDDRGRLVLDHLSRYAGQLDLRVDLETVTDTSYFDDLGDSLDRTSRTHLDRRADLVWRRDALELRARVQSYQTIATTLSRDERPYKRLPQVAVGYAPAPGPGGVRVTLNGEWVAFDHESLPGGRRIDLRGRLSRRFGSPGVFLEPAVDLRYTGYDLDAGFASERQDPSRGVSGLSLDSGLIFERPLAGGTQTLEPRLFYLFRPAKDQDDLPIFDSVELDFRFPQLFRNDRFAGADRVGDANQVSLALSSRFLDARGRTLVQAGIGQIVYFDDREVTLPREAVAQRARSPLLAELRLRPNARLAARANWVWDDVRNQTDASLLELRYQGAERLYASLGYRYLRGDQEQVDLSFFVPVRPRWRLIGRHNFSFRDSRLIFAAAGIEYEGCCWALRVGARRFLVDEGASFNDAISLQLILKGLAGIGYRADDLFRPSGLINEAIF